jgi:hypothetical protein
VIILVVAVSAFLYDMNSQKKQTSANPALKIGDIFTYKLNSNSVLGSADAAIPQELLQYNNTEYYQVTVTEINGVQVTFGTRWQFNNGTQISSTQIIDLTTGTSNNPIGFNYLFCSNLNVMISFTQRKRLDSA